MAGECELTIACGQECTPSFVGVVPCTGPGSASLRSAAELALPRGCARGAPCVGLESAFPEIQHRDADLPVRFTGPNMKFVERLPFLPWQPQIALRTGDTGVVVDLSNLSTLSELPRWRILFLCGGVRGRQEEEMLHKAL